MLQKMCLAALGLIILMVMSFCYKYINLMSEYNSAVEQVAVLNRTLEAKEAIISTNQMVMDSLQETKDKLLAEKEKTDNLVKTLLEKPENKKWGCEEVPEDIADFIYTTYNLECERKVKK